MRQVAFHVNQRQRLFFEAKAAYVAYGGARGGGKTWAARNKARLLALYYRGIRILFLRRTYQELLETIILPMTQELNGLARWKESEKAFLFPNGSRIRMGYCDSEHDVDQYQGQEYDVLFLEEATQFTEYQFQTLAACVRGVNDYPKRMYLTCNPGGPGHGWVKRLFVDRDFRGSERSEDYLFIPAKATDNPDLMRTNPRYLERLDNLPDGIREAWRDGNWDVFAGQYFTEWDRERHVCAPFTPPAWWRWFVTMDYGLDLLAAYLVAVDEGGRAWVVDEVTEGRDLGEGHKGLLISQAAERVKAMVGERRIYAYLAPPDLWNARQETGKSVADIFAEHGVYLTRTSNDRVAGWLAVKEWLRVEEDEQGLPAARLQIFPGCKYLIRTLPMLEYDRHNPSDCAREPHDITHGADALRGFCVYWTGRADRRSTPGREKLIKRLERRGKRVR